MPPQPLSSFKRRGVVLLGHPAIRLYPEMAALAMGVISTWALIDRSFAAMVSSMLRADFAVVTAMLNSLTSGEGRRAAINAAAAETLKNDQEMMRLFGATTKAIAPSKETRNRFAHYNWVYIDGLGEAVGLIDPKYLGRFTAEHRHYRLGEATPTAVGPRRSFPDFPLSKIFVYRKKEFDEEVSAADRALLLVTNLTLALEKSTVGAEARQQLLADAQIQAILQQQSKRSTP